MLLVSLLCLWWDFSQQEFPKVVSESWERPIFAVCTIPECPHCMGMGDRLREFATNTEYDDVVFTHVNCRESDICRRAKVTRVPVVVLIRGSSVKYWRQTHAKTPGEWREFLERSLKSRLYRNGVAQSLASNETVFELRVPEGASDVVSEFERVAKIYEVFGCTFTYSFGSPMEITAHLSRSCAVKQTIERDEIEAFVKKYKFGDAHHFDRGEFKEQRKATPIALSLVRDTVRSSQLAALKAFSGAYCGRIRFGWASAQLDPTLWDVANMTVDNAPVLYATNSVRELPCSVVSRRKTGDRVHMRMLEHVLKGTKCTNDTLALTEDDAETPKMLPYFVTYYVVSMVIGVAALLSTICINPGERYKQAVHGDCPEADAL